MRADSLPFGFVTPDQPTQSVFRGVPNHSSRFNAAGYEIYQKQIDGLLSDNGLLALGCSNPDDGVPPDFTQVGTGTVSFSGTVVEAKTVDVASYTAWVDRTFITTDLEAETYVGSLYVHGLNGVFVGGLLPDTWDVQYAAPVTIGGSSTGFLGACGAVYPISACSDEGFYLSLYFMECYGLSYNYLQKTYGTGPSQELFSFNVTSYADYGILFGVKDSDGRYPYSTGTIGTNDRNLYMYNGGVFQNLPASGHYIDENGDAVAGSFSTQTLFFDSEYQSFRSGYEIFWPRVQRASGSTVGHFLPGYHTNSATSVCLSQLLYIEDGQESAPGFWAGMVPAAKGGMGPGDVPNGEAPFDACIDIYDYFNSGGGKGKGGGGKLDPWESEAFSCEPDLGAGWLLPYIDNPSGVFDGTGGYSNTASYTTSFGTLSPPWPIKAFFEAGIETTTLTAAEFDPPIELDNSPLIIVVGVSSFTMPSWDDGFSGGGKGGPTGPVEWYVELDYPVYATFQSREVPELTKVVSLGTINAIRAWDAFDASILHEFISGGNTQVFTTDLIRYLQTTDAAIIPDPVLTKISIGKPSGSSHPENGISTGNTFFGLGYSLGYPECGTYCSSGGTGSEQVPAGFEALDGFESFYSLENFVAGFPNLNAIAVSLSASVKVFRGHP